jgi:hypothetical protein
MSTRRIVAAQRNGRSIIVEDATVPSNAFASVPGFDPVLVWGTPALPTLPWGGCNPITDSPSVMPLAGETRIWTVTFPPDAVMAEPSFNPAAAGMEYLQRLPGLAELFERDHPGMHRTDSIDYDIVIDGEMTVEFDDGIIATLGCGDVLIQYGTRHAWRNRSGKSAKILFIVIGALGSSRQHSEMSSP